MWPALVVAGPLALILFLVILLGGGSSNASPLNQATGGLSSGAPLKGAGIPNPAWASWVAKAGSMCSTITGPIIAAQIEVESGWNPTAVSPTGAQGLSQFEPGTWPAYAQAEGPGAVSPFNPPDAIMAQGRYDCALASALSLVAKASGISDLTLALDGYNAGMGAVIAANGIPLNPQTQTYAPKIEALAATYTAPSATTVTAGSFARAVVAAATAQIGRPYVWGGGSDTGPSGSAVAPPGMVGQPGFDCSGLVLYAIFQASHGTIALPHLSELQVTMGQAVAAGPGSRVLSSGALQPGDVIGFYNLDGTNAWDHIGIYVGNGEMVAAPQTGQTVQLQNLNTPYWLGVRWNVRRFA